jgi:hypothetical protein
MKLDKSQIYVIDNLIPIKEQYNYLQNILYSPIKASYSDLVYDQCNLKIVNSPYTKILPENQFIINLGQEKTIFLDIIEKKFSFKIKKIIRSKINWITREHISSKNGYYPPHTDSNLDHWVLIYYVNTSDGNTLMFEETQNEIPFYSVSNQTLHIKHSIEHKMGRGVLFHGSRYHGGLPPIESSYRILVNHNFIIE